jgi:branched-chain amino acid transport system ATP-binding protein
LSRPKLLLLDEPSLGLAPLIVQQVYCVIADIRRQGTTVLLVEQNAHMALSPTVAYVLETGQLIVQGRPEEPGQRGRADGVSWGTAQRGLVGRVE